MLTQITRLLDRIGAVLAKILILIGGLALILLIPIFGWMVFGRYVLNATPTWVDQASLVLIVLITFPVAAAGFRDNSHLAVSYVRDSCPPRIAAVLAVISYIAMTVFGYYMLQDGMKLVAFNWAKTMPIIRISDGWRSVPMAVCGAAICFYSVVHILKIITGWKQIAQSRYYSDDMFDERSE
ncbi:MAG: TRAP transporter small permease [Pseudomonadota bacterium]